MRKVIAICCRSKYVAMVVVAGGKLYDWHRHDVHGYSLATIRRLIADFAADYGLTEAIIEPRATVLLPRPMHPIVTPLIEAKQRLLPHQPRPTNRAIIQRLVSDTPSLRPLITIAAATGAVSMTRPWQIAVLLACVLALAHESQTGELKAPTHYVY